MTHVESTTSVLVNATPHPCTFFDANGQAVGSVPPSGITPRLGTEDMGPAGGVDVAGHVIGVVGVRYSDLVGLPEPVDGTYYIVPLLVALARPDRPDLLVPHEQVRNESGTVLGCRSLGRIA